MKSYKDLLNEIAKSNSDILKPLTKTESAALKALMVEMYCDLAALCDAHGLTYMLGGGSCLGAVRHQGFIEWDDDLDVNMPRQDYEKLKQLLMNGEMSDKYEFTCPNSGKDAPCCFLKLYRKGTKLMTMGSDESVYPIGVNIDVFIMDGVPDNPLVRYVKGWLSDSIRLIANVVSEASHPLPENYIRFIKQDMFTYCVVKLRRFLGHIFSIIPHRKWIDLFDDFVRCDVPEHGLVTYPTGRFRYNGEAMDVSTHLPVRKGMFEGIAVNLPAKAEEYLRHNYGDDYMHLPVLEKRECHFVVDVDLNI